MSKEQLEAFLQAVREDADLAKKLKEAGDNNAIVAVAKAAGFVISVDDVENTAQVLSDAEIESMVGGGFFDTCIGSGRSHDVVLC